MLPHGEIIVGAPHCDRLWPIMSGKAARIGKGTLVAQYVHEHAVATLGVKSIDCLRKNVLIVHRMPCHSYHLSITGPLASQSQSLLRYPLSFNRNNSIRSKAGRV